MQMTTRERIELVVLATIWGASFLFMRIAVPEFGPIALVQVRVTIAALFLLAVLSLRPGGLRPLASYAGPLTFVGIVSSALPFVLFAYATLHVTAGTAAVLNATAPLFGAAVAFVWLRDRLPPARLLGLLVGFCGVLVLAWDKIGANGHGTLLAVAAGLLGSLSYGIAVNYTKTRLHAVDPIVNAAGSQVASTLLLLPLTIWHWPEAAPSMTSWLAVLALGILSTGIAYIIYFRLIVRIGPAKAITVTYLVPAFGMVWGLVFLGEAITAGMVVACAVILAGTALATGNLSLGSRPARGRTREVTCRR
jgi:drug/metabolite transporter (DMT)-like permease